MKKTSKHIKILISVAIFGILILLASTSLGASLPRAEYIKSSGMAIVDTGDYLIYLNDNGNFEYSFDDVSYSPCHFDSEGNRMIRVPKASIGAAANLWTTGGVVLTNVPVDYTKALTQAEIDNIKALANEANPIIKILLGSAVVKDDDGRNVTVDTVELIDDRYSEYKYVLVKAYSGADKKAVNDNYYQLVQLANLLEEDYLDTCDPIDAIYHMAGFADLYNQLLLSAQSNWKVATDDRVLEPLDSVKGDIYVLWLMADDRIIDLQILLCGRVIAPEVVPGRTIVLRLPRTGADFILEAAILVTIVAIALVTVRIRTLKRRAQA